MLSGRSKRCCPSEAAESFFSSSLLELTNKNSSASSSQSVRGNRTLLIKHSTTKKLTQTFQSLHHHLSPLASWPRSDLGPYMMLVTWPDTEPGQRRRASDDRASPGLRLQGCPLSADQHLNDAIGLRHLELYVPQGLSSPIGRIKPLRWSSRRCTTAQQLLRDIKDRGFSSAFFGWNNQLLNGLPASEFPVGRNCI